MADQSHLDNKYFVDERVYNCPFCNRRHVAYHVFKVAPFDWTNQKCCKAFFVRCESCEKESMHLSFNPPEIDYVGNWRNGGPMFHFTSKHGVALGNVLDDSFFYSVPTSFFVLDERVPRILRELLTEAEGCLKSNYLTGASACARKIVYELCVLSEAGGDNYDERIKSLKEVHSEVDPAFFDTLLTIQQLTSTKVHEGSYDGWDAKHLKVVLASLAEVLREIYVVPALREDRRSEVLALKDSLMPKAKKDAGAES